MGHLEILTGQVALAGLDVVDVGAGLGGFAAQMAGAGARAIGVEIEAAKVRDAANANPSVRMLLGRGEALPLEDGSADLVTFIYSFHHVPPVHHAAALTEVCRVLRRGGRLHVAEPDVQGAMSEIIAPVEDETEVRTAALKALTAASDTHGLTLERKGSYDLTRHFADFDALVAASIRVDPARAARFVTAGDEVRARFERLATQTDAGWRLEQPTTFHHFRLAKGAA